MTDANASATPAPSPSAAPAPTATPASGAPSPAPSPSPSPAPSPSPSPSATPAPTETPTPKPTDTPAYKIPEAYKDKPWAAKIKSEEDLYKQVDNLTSLVGKKTVVPDFKTAAPADIEAWLASTRPASVEAYTFGETVDPEFKSGVGKILFENGVSEYQANKMIPAYQALEQQRLEAVTSEDGFKAVMTKRFGEKYDTNVAQVSKGLEKYASPDDQKILDILPNEYLGTVYTVVDKLLSEIATIKKEHGIVENGDAHTDKGGTPVPEGDVTKVRADLRKEISALDKKPHTADERQALINKLDATYRTKKG